MPISPRARIITMFVMHAIAQGGFFSRIPDIQEQLGMDKAELGLALLGQPVGAILSFLVTSELVERIGTRPCMTFAVPAMAVLMALTGAVPNSFMLAVVLALYGAVFALANIAINVEADRLEASSGVRLFNTCHGSWSIGMLGATIFATLMRGAGVSPLVHFLLVVPVVLIGVALAAIGMESAPPRPHSAAARKFRVALPTGMTLLLVGYSIGSALLEGGLRNWSVIFMRESFSAPEWVDTLTLPVFLVAQSVGRIMADSAVGRWGPVPLARGLGLVALVGLLMVVLAPNLTVALAGFTVMGAGVSVAFPLSTSAAARLGDRPSSENVAALTMSQQMLLLGTPALLGFIATAWGIRATFAVLVPPILVAIYLSRFLAPRPAAEAPAAA